MDYELARLLHDVHPVVDEDAAPHDPQVRHAQSLLLDDLQSNILSGHHKTRSRYFFLGFPDADPIGRQKASFLLGLLARNHLDRVLLLSGLSDRRFLEEIPPGAVREALRSVTSASGPFHLGQETCDALKSLRLVSERETRRLPLPRRSGRGKAESAPDAAELVLTVLLTRSGYEKLGVAPPPDAAFREGMAERGPRLLHDPDPEHWEPGFAQTDAVLAVAYDPASGQRGHRQRAALEALRSVIDAHAEVLRQEDGALLRAKSKRGKEVVIEPFGFVDGLSQPRFYRSRGSSGKGTHHPLAVALRPDPNGRTKYACGSYVVFRKLRQDVEKLYDQVRALAASSNRESEEVLAELVGRRRDGTPLVGHDGSEQFDFTDDPHGMKCPFHSHVRRVNPRGDVRPSERDQHVIVRRAVPYGGAIERDDRGAPVLVDGKVRWLDPSAPREVGLLFFCAQGDIALQFEHIQRAWANNPRFPWSKLSGADALIGQVPSGETNRIASIRLDSNGQRYTRGLDTLWGPVVQLRGGEYFFAPSIRFLTGLLDDLCRWTGVEAVKKGERR